MKRPTPKPRKTAFVIKPTDRLCLFRFTGEKVGPDGMFRIPVIPPLGAWVHPVSGPFEVTEEDRRQMMANFKPGVPVGYNHGISDPVSAEAGKAAGELLSLEDEPDENGWTYGTALMTEAGAAYVNKREYYAVSPTIMWNTLNMSGENVGASVFELSLTNTPFYRDVRLSRTPTENAMEDKEKTQMMEGEGGTLAKTRFDEASGRVYVVGPLALAEGEEAAIALPDNLRVAPKAEGAAAPEAEKMSASLTQLSQQVTDRNTQLSTLQASVKQAETRLAEIERKAFDTEVSTVLKGLNVVPRLHARFAAMATAAEQAKKGTGIEAMKGAVKDFGDAIIVHTDAPGHGGDPESVNLSTVGETELKKLRTEGGMTQRQAMLHLARTNPEAFNAMQYQ